MFDCIIVNKNGDLMCKKMKKIEKKYTLCSYKNDKDFELLNIYNNIKNKKYVNVSVEVYGKKKGRANNENKYEFAPPIDTELYFGTLLLLMKNKDTQEYMDMNLKVWEEINEILFGGFEDLDDDETRSEDSEVYDEDDYTKDGYLKDDFIVDDDELEEEEYCETDEDEHEDEQDDE